MNKIDKDSAFRIQDSGSKGDAFPESRILNPESSLWHHKRLRAEKRFRFYGQCALGVAVLMLVLLIGSLMVRGVQGFSQTQIRIPLTYDAELLGDAPYTPSGYQKIVQASLRQLFPEVTERADLKKLYGLASSGAGLKLKRKLDGKTAWPQERWVPASSAVDLFVKGKAEASNLTDQQQAWLAALQEKGAVRRAFNASFFTDGDSRNPEQAGFLNAMAGSALTLLICLAVVFPLGVATAVYLEEFAHKSRWVSLVEVNINNLAAVPSIVFGLLGLAVYINVMGMPRSSTLVGGMTLALMILPVIIIATRASLASIPGSIRDAARALGATPVQVVWHHVLPLSMPGIMTGTILGMARAIGETAPLLMIGMVAFVADLPSGFTSPATVMPVQIYLWTSSPEAGFAEKTAAGILTLLVLLLAMNLLAIILRKRFEVRW